MRRAGRLALLLGHALFKSALFLVVGVIDRQLSTRDIGELSGVGRQAPTLRDNSYEFGQVTDSRNLQLEALKQQQAAAMGLGPSVAAQQNKMSLGQGMNAMGAGMGGGNLLAQRQAMMGGNAMLGQASQQGAAARGGEIYGAMGAYGQGAAGLRSGDLGAQRSAFDQIAAQRQLQLNQARSNTGTVQGYEALDFDTAKSYSDLARANHARNVEAGMDSQKQTAGMAGTAATTMATLAMLAAAL